MYIINFTISTSPPLEAVVISVLPDQENPDHNDANIALMGV